MKGCTGASFCLHVKYLKMQTTLTFCRWYTWKNTNPSFNQKLSCLNLIIGMFEKLIREIVGHQPPHATRKQEYIQSGRTYPKFSSILISDHGDDQGKWYLQRHL